MAELTTDENIAVLNTTMQTLNTTLQDLRTDLKDNYVRKDVYASDQKSVWNHINNHKAWLTWAQRLVIGAVALAVLTVYFKSSGSLP